MDIQTKEVSSKLAVTVEEACQIASIGKTQLYAHLSSGKIPAKKLGARTLILHRDLENFLQNLENYPTKGGIQ